jgi:predicted PurR-regulated permease PerM
MRMALDEAQLDETRPRESAAPHPKPAKFHWALTALGIATILAICYWAELVLAVVMLSVMLAFILAPLVDFLMRWRLPRGVAALISVTLLVTIIAALLYYTSNQAATFFQDVPQYAGKIRTAITNFRQRAESFGGLKSQEQSGRSSPDWTGTLMRGVGSVTQGLAAASFVPFLVYFMLTWQHHVRSATVMLFSLENRHTAYVTLGLISAMIRSFMVGNLLIGLFMGTISTIVFGILKFPFFYFVGFISGFLSLIPYLGVLLAVALPAFVGIGHVESAAVLGALVTVVGLHLLAINVLYPKFLGNRLQLNPLIVTIALLVWGWLWGAIGLVLAIPVTAAMKIVFDHVHSLKPYGAWLGE